MLIEEIKYFNGTEYCVHYSDNNKIIHKINTDEYYFEAWDIIPCKFTYEETDNEVIIIK